MNYQPDRTTEPLTFTNMTRNINARITYQATQKNKFNFFWDEGLTCQDPCDGAVASWAPRDGNWSGQVHPARLRQVSWTNPLTNRILLEAGVAANTQLYDFSHHRYVPGHQDIPRVVEFGTDRRHGRRVARWSTRPSAIFGRAVRQPQQRSGRRGRIPESGRLPSARLGLVRHGLAQREVRI